MIILLLLIFSVIISFVIIESYNEKSIRIENNTLALTDSLLKKIKDSEKRYVRDSLFYPKKTSRKQYQSTRSKTVYTNIKEEQKTSEVIENNFRPKYKKQEKFPEGTLVDINTADTTILKKIPGIGSVISRNIVRYRERLGGFYDINQILEVRYVDSSFLKWFKMEKGVYRKLKVNTDNLDILKTHPYMNYYRAKAIIDYRNRRGKIENILQISLLKEFSDKDIQKLEQYLDFQ